MNIKELKIACYLYGRITNFDNSYKKIFEIDNINLNEHKHVESLLNWLRGWGCRQFKKEYEKLSTKNIMKWYQKYKDVLPDASTNLLDSVPDAVKYFDNLATRRASIRIRENEEIKVNIGSVGAAKILFAIRPKVFPPWDTPICKALRYKMTGEGYLKYLKDVQEHLLKLKEECKSRNQSIHDLPRIVDRDISSLPKLIDEYNWITITQNINPQELIALTET